MPSAKATGVLRERERERRVSIALYYTVQIRTTEWLSHEDLPSLWQYWVAIVFIIVIVVFFIVVLLCIRDRFLDLLGAFVCICV